MPIRMLVTTDGSEPSRMTERMAVRLARALPAEILLTHVINLERLEYKMIPDFQVEMIQAGAKRTAEVLLQGEAAFFAEQGITVEPKLLVGAPGPAVCSYAERQGATLVVTGRRGQGDIQDVLFGSVSNHILHHCNKPVLVAKQKGRIPDPEHYGEPLRVLVALDRSVASTACVDFLVDLGEAGSGLRPTLVHVVNPARPGLEHLPGAAQYDALRALHDDAAAMLEAAAERLTRAGYRVDTRVEEGSTGRTLCRLHEEDEYDLIIMGRREVGEIEELFVGSVCHFVVHHCPGHVLVIP